MLTPDEVFPGNRLIAGLGAGASDASGTAVTVPSVLGWDDEGSEIYLPPGTYYLGAIADPSNAIGEPDETNNGLSGNKIEIM